MQSDLHREFGPKGNATVRIVVGLAVAIASAALLAAPWTWPAFQQMAPVTKWQARVLGGFFLGAGLLLCASTLRIRRVRVEVDAERVTLFEENRQRACRWDEVIALHETRRLGTPYEADNFGLVLAWVKGENRMVALVDKAGNHVLLKNVVRDFSALAEIVQRETLARLLPPAQAAFSAGEMLKFGRFGIDREKVRFDDNSLSWAEVASFTAEQGLIRINKRGKRLAWAKSPVTDVPSAHILIAVAQEHLNAQRREE